MRPTGIEPVSEAPQAPILSVKLWALLGLPPSGVPNDLSYFTTERCLRLGLGLFEGNFLGEPVGGIVYPGFFWLLTKGYLFGN